MATWIAHLRVAERLINLGIASNTDGFIVGNIAPDSGVPNDDRSSFEKDWYGHDLWFLQDNPNSLFFRCYQHLTKVRDVLPYFPDGAVGAQAEYIKNYYLTRLPEFSPDREWLYLSKTEMDNYINEATAFCISRLGDN